MVKPFGGHRPRWGAYSAPPNPSASGEELAVPSPRTVFLLSALQASIHASLS